MELLPWLLFLLGTWGVGRALERRHLRSLARRELRSRSFRVTTCTALPGPAGAGGASEATLVTGSVVVSPDYFRRIVGLVRSVFGGPIPGYERILERGRREALLRMKEAAFAAGYRAVVNVRLETARLASSTRDGEGTSGVEVLAVGTALRLPRR